MRGACWLVALGAMLSGLTVFAGEIPDPVFRESFQASCVVDNFEWKASSQLRRQPDWAERFRCPEPGSFEGTRHLTVSLRPGDGYDVSPGSNPTERAEIEVKRRDLVEFDHKVWYSFAFRLEGPWVTGANRTVIHQIKQNLTRIFNMEETPNAPCPAANPFFRVHAREVNGVLSFIADVAGTTGCPSDASRHVVCAPVPIETDRWHRVHVALRPSQRQAGGFVRVWLDGKECGAYHGLFGYPSYGVRRDGRPYVDTQPRFGVYRDAVPQPQQVSFDAIAFWADSPAGHPIWAGIAPIETE